MKVLQAITSLGVGGAERVVLTLASRLPDDRVQSAVVCFSSDTDALEVFSSALEVKVFEMKRGLLVALSSLFSYAAFLRTYRPDLVHTHLFHAFVITLLAQMLSLRFVPIVFTLHSSTCPPLRSLILRGLRRWRRFDVVFSEGDLGAPWLRHPTVLPNGVEVSGSSAPRSWQPQTGPTFIFVGRLVDEKCPSELIVQVAAADLPEWRLLMVGSGPHLGRVRATIDNLNLGERVSLLGRRSEIRQLLRSADVFLCFSDREGLPMALLEAGAEGLVVVSTPVGAIPELLADDAGYLADKSEYAQTIRQVVADRDGALERARRLHERVVLNYSAGAMVRGHLALYEQVLAPSGHSRGAA